MQNNDIIDIWRQIHGNKMQFTWHSKPIIHSRLDYFHESNKIRNIIKSCTVTTVNIFLKLQTNIFKNCKQNNNKNKLIFNTNSSDTNHLQCVGDG